MPIISVLNPKGGCCKTTISTNLAAHYSKRKSILLIDSDQQLSASTWCSLRDFKGITCKQLPTAAKLRGVKKISQNFDYTIIDGASKLENLLLPSIEVADLVLIPITPSAYDLWAVKDLVEILQAFLDKKDNKLQVVFIVMRAVKKTILSRKIKEAIRKFGFPVLESHTTNKVAYVNGLSDGQSVIDGKSPSVGMEITAIASELDLLLQKAG